MKMTTNKTHWLIVEHVGDIAMLILDEVGRDSSVGDTILLEEDR